MEVGVGAYFQCPPTYRQSAQSTWYIMQKVLRPKIPLLMAYMDPPSKPVTATSCWTVTEISDDTQCAQWLQIVPHHGSCRLRGFLIAIRPTIIPHWRDMVWYTVFRILSETLDKDVLDTTYCREQCSFVGMNTSELIYVYIILLLFLYYFLFLQGNSARFDQARTIYYMHVHMLITLPFCC